MAQLNPQFDDYIANSFRKNYVIWITDTKTEATRQNRLSQAIEWITDGKGRFWQSEK